MRTFIFPQITLQRFPLSLHRMILERIKPLNICDDTISSNITFSTPALSDLSETGALVDPLLYLTSVKLGV